jgi:prepilin-type N-terminal cleavage/methylation domain-containing protein
MGNASKGFTLIEILIVVVILGVLAAIVLPQFIGVTGEVERGTFVADLRIFVNAAERYRLDTGEYLEDSASGECPAGLEVYIEEEKWETVTPIGGVWDAELDSFGIKSALGVHFNGEGETRDDEYMLLIDDAFDNGDLATGAFRKIADGRYYFVLQDV